MKSKRGFTLIELLVATLTADDLLRAVGKEMRQRAGDNTVAQQVANELTRAGVADLSITQ
jgi:type II secretory pathway pseudopilin PulG